MYIYICVCLCVLRGTFFFLINTLEWKKAEDRDEVFGKESDNVNWHVVYGDEGCE